MKEVFVLVDYQSDFIDESLGFDKALEIKENILETSSQIDFNNTHLLLTYDTHDEGYLKNKEGLSLSIEHCIKDSSGWQMPKDFTSFLQKVHKVFHKDAFGSLESVNFIAESEYKEIHFARLVPHIYVFYNIILALSTRPDSRFILHQNLGTSFDKNLEKSAFDLPRAYDIKIL